MNNNEKTHYRKAFNSPYLSSADIVCPTVLTISHVRLEKDKTKKTKDFFNTAYFSEKFIRDGEILKPMVLNATNSRTMRKLSGSAFIEDWCNIPVTIYVDNKIRFGRDTVEGLRISTEAPKIQKQELTKGSQLWQHAVDAYRRDGDFIAIEKRMIVSEKTKNLIIEDANALG